MTERKFTDEQIIKALECLAFTEGSCVGCIYQSAPFSTCRELVARQTLDLINRQRAEIDDLTKDTIPKLKYGLERANKYGVELEKSLANAKAEAIKEFAERLKASFPDKNDPHFTADDAFTLNYIDYLVEEMTEGKPCTEGADCFAAEGKE